MDKKEGGNTVRFELGAIEIDKRVIPEKVSAVLSMKEEKKLVLSQKK